MGIKEELQIRKAKNIDKKHPWFKLQGCNEIDTQFLLKYSNPNTKPFTDNL